MINVCVWCCDAPLNGTGHQCGPGLLKITDSVMRKHLLKSVWHDVVHIY